MMYSTFLALGWVTLATAHAGHDQKTLAGPHQSLWYNKLPGDGGTQVISINIISFPDHQNTNMR